MHQCRHSGVESMTAEIKARYWILKASKLTHKSVKFKCTFCQEMVPVHRVENQQMTSKGVYSHPVTLKRKYAIRTTPLSGQTMFH